MFRATAPTTMPPTATAPTMTCAVPNTRRSRLSSGPTGARAEAPGGTFTSTRYTEDAAGAA